MRKSNLSKFGSFSTIPTLFLLILLGSVISNASNQSNPSHKITMRDYVQGEYIPSVFTFQGNMTVNATGEILIFNDGSDYIELKFGILIPVQDILALHSISLEGYVQNWNETWIEIETGNNNFTFALDSSTGYNLDITNLGDFICHDDEIMMNISFISTCSNENAYMRFTDLMMKYNYISEKRIEVTSDYLFSIESNDVKNKSFSFDQVMNKCEIRAMPVNLAINETFDSWGIQMNGSVGEFLLSFD